MFKYHPDNEVYEEGIRKCDFPAFIASNPAFPVVEGGFFEYKDGVLELINTDGHHTAVNVEDYQQLINTIENKFYTFPEVVVEPVEPVNEEPAP